MNPNDVVHIADTAAQKSDRVLFIVALIVLGICAVFVARFFVKQYEDLIRDHKAERQEYQTSLRQIVAAQNETMRELTICLTRNTEALDTCSTELRYCRDRRPAS